MNGLLYVDNLVLCGESEEDLRAMVGHFVEVCRRRGLKVNEGKNKVMVLGGEEGVECEVTCMGGDWRMRHNFSICDVFWMNQVQMKQSVLGRWQVGGGLHLLLGF